MRELVTRGLVNWAQTIPAYPACASLIRAIFYPFYCLEHILWTAIFSLFSKCHRTWPGWDFSVYKLINCAQPAPTCARHNTTSTSTTKLPISTCARQADTFSHLVRLGGSGLTRGAQIYPSIYPLHILDFVFAYFVFFLSHQSNIVTWSKFWPSAFKCLLCSIVLSSIFNAVAISFVRV